MGVMTVLYAQQVNDECPTTNETLTAPGTPCTSTKFRGDSLLGIGALSHINLVANDSVDAAAAYYQEILGFYPANNTDGPMTYYNITIPEFCADAGLQSDCHLDIRFLKHPIVNLYIEIMYYYLPSGDRKIPMFPTNNAGGIRHGAVEVENSTIAYENLKKSNHQGKFLTQQGPVVLPGYGIWFFYWIDKYGIQWEFEHGRPILYYRVAGITG